MQWSTASRILFIVYCLEVGIFLLFAPWSANWEHIWLQLPLAGAEGVLFHPAFRGSITGFGFVHLLWGAHDLEQLLLARRARLREAEPDQADHAG